MSDGPLTEVDPWRFTGSFLKGVLSAGIPAKPTHEKIPWTPLEKPLAACRVALLSTAGLSMRSDTPFDMETERKHPTRGDSSWRALTADATAETIDANHLHIDTGYVLRDLNVALPVDRLRELARAGEVGTAADTHYSIMGYQGSDSSALVEQSAPDIASRMLGDEVDLALLAPV